MTKKRNQEERTNFQDVPEDIKSHILSSFKTALRLKDTETLKRVFNLSNPVVTLIKGELTDCWHKEWRIEKSDSDVLALAIKQYLGIDLIR